MGAQLLVLSLIEIHSVSYIFNVISTQHPLQQLSEIGALPVQPLEPGYQLVPWLYAILMKINRFSMLFQPAEECSNVVPIRGSSLLRLRPG